MKKTVNEWITEGKRRSLAGNGMQLRPGQYKGMQELDAVVLRVGNIIGAQLEGSEHEREAKPLKIAPGETYNPSEAMAVAATIGLRGNEIADFIEAAAAEYAAKRKIKPATGEHARSRVAERSLLQDIIPGAVIEVRSYGGMTKVPEMWHVDRERPAADYARASSAPDRVFERDRPAQAKEVMRKSKPWQFEAKMSRDEAVEILTETRDAIAMEGGVRGSAVEVVRKAEERAAEIPPLAAGLQFLLGRNMAGFDAAIATIRTGFNAPVVKAAKLGKETDRAKEATAGPAAPWPSERRKEEPNAAEKAVEPNEVAADILVSNEPRVFPRQASRAAVIAMLTNVRDAIEKAGGLKGEALLAVRNIERQAGTIPPVVQGMQYLLDGDHAAFEMILEQVRHGFRPGEPMAKIPRSVVAEAPVAAVAKVEPVAAVARVESEPVAVATKVESTPAVDAVKGDGDEARLRPITTVQAGAGEAFSRIAADGQDRPVSVPEPKPKAPPVPKPKQAAPEAKAAIEMTPELARTALELAFAEGKPGINVDAMGAARTKEMVRFVTLLREASECSSMAELGAKIAVQNPGDNERPAMNAANLAQALRQIISVDTAADSKGRQMRPILIDDPKGLDYAGAVARFVFPEESQASLRARCLDFLSMKWL